MKITLHKTPWKDERADRIWIPFSEWKALKKEREALWEKRNKMDDVRKGDRTCMIFCALMSAFCFMIAFLAAFTPGSGHAFFTVIIVLLFLCSISFFSLSICYGIGGLHWRDSALFKRKYGGNSLI